jgi:hypothetical protein
MDYKKVLEEIDKDGDSVISDPLRQDYLKLRVLEVGRLLEEYKCLKERTDTDVSCALPESWREVRLKINISAYFSHLSDFKYTKK